MTACAQCAAPVPEAARSCPSCGTPAWGTPVDELAARAAEVLAPEYELIREIGRGGMGVVYLAREVALDRDVALKVLPPQYGRDPVLSSRFIQEARTAARLDHPHIVPIYQVLERGGLSLFAMKYVTGASLHASLRAQGALGFEEVRRILRSSAEALAYAHRGGVVHRDVKPANILVDDRDWVYVTDFGIAKAIAEDTPSTRSGAVMGTPHYLAPELCRGGRADALTDQYALAIVGYQLLCGRLPFDGDTMEAILAQRLFGDPPSVRPYRPDVPADLEYAVERGMRRDRAARFATLLEMAEFLGGAEATTPRAGSRRRLRRLLAPEELPTVQLTLRGRARGIVRAAAATAAVIAVAVAGSLWAFGRPAPSDRLWPLARSPMTSPAGGETDAKPEPPAATLDLIQQNFEIGRVFTDMGRYEDALAEYRHGLERIEEAARHFSTAGPIDSLKLDIQKAVEETKLACAKTPGQDCTGSV